MYMNLFAYDDRLEALGVGVGAFVILVGLGTLLGMPWTTNEATGAAIVQTIGTLLTIGIGLVLIQFSYSGDLLDLLPGGAERSDE